ncbi:hypothetical protein MMC25_003748 [Agyrium rufum]|nr:hypothetical protein [Agyrium rufum]
MSKALQALVSRAQDLTDIELAILLSLIANEHCILETHIDALETLADELQLISSNTYGLSSTVVACSSKTTLEDFGAGVLLSSARDSGNEWETSGYSDRGGSSFAPERSESSSEKRIANIVIAKDLNLAPTQVQIQALELLRTNRIFTHTAVHSTPKPFLLVALVATDSIALVKHLNDHVFISHYHDPADGFANIEEGTEWIADDHASESSVLHKTHAKASLQNSLFSIDDVRHLTDESSTVQTGIEVFRYLHNIVIFLRTHRAVGKGVTPRATKHFEHLVECLAPLHGLDYVTPSLVALATRKIYRHRIAIVAPENELSMQYGSELEAVRELLAGLTSDDIIQEVLEMVEAPL